MDLILPKKSNGCPASLPRKRVSGQSLSKVKETVPETKQVNGGWIKSRDLASGVKSSTSISDFEDKPYKAAVSWVSQKQDSKIYPTKEDAEKGKDWLPPGKVAGSDNARTASQNFTATLYYHDDAWWLDDITWASNLSGIDTKGSRDSLWSMKRGNQTSWSAVLNDAAGRKTAKKQS